MGPEIIGPGVGLGFVLGLVIGIGAPKLYAWLKTFKQGYDPKNR